MSIEFRPPRPRIRTWKFLLIVLGIPALIIIAGVSAWWVILNQRAYAHLAHEVAKVRARGEPLTSVELNDYYAAAPGRPDMTKEILAALAQINTPELGELNDRLQISLSTSLDVPLPPETWIEIDEVAVPNLKCNWGSK